MRRADARAAALPRPARAAALPRLWNEFDFLNSFPHLRRTESLASDVCVSVVPDAPQQDTGEIGERGERRHERFLGMKCSRGEFPLLVQAQVGLISYCYSANGRIGCARLVINQQSP